MIRALAAAAVLLLVGCASTERVAYLEWRLGYVEEHNRKLTSYLHHVHTGELDLGDVSWLLRDNARQMDSLTQALMWMTARRRFIWSKPPLPQPRTL